MEDLKYKMKQIYFKTKSPYFEKERDGLKCNTVRELGFDDTRHEDLMNWLQTKEPTEITIINPLTDERFTRIITDVTYYDERWIISWHNPKQFLYNFEELNNRKNKNEI